MRGNAYNLIKAPRVKHGGAKQAAREGEIEAAKAEIEGEAEEIAQTGPSARARACATTSTSSSSVSTWASACTRLYDTGRSGWYNIPRFNAGVGLHLAIGYPF